MKTNSDYPKIFWFEIALKKGHYRAEINIDNELAEMISQMFEVPYKGPDADGRCVFDDESVKNIESQLSVGVDMHSLTKGVISLGVLVLLANSPRCSHRLTIQRVIKGFDLVTYYTFVPKTDILRSERPKEI